MKEPEDRTLDPVDRDAFRATAHEMVDVMLDHLFGLRNSPAWQPMPPEVRSSFDEPVPYTPQGDAPVFEQFVKTILPYTNGNIHPRFFGWVQGNGTPLAMMADMLAAGLNPHMAGFDQAPALVEEQVLGWLKDLMGFPPDSSGLLLSGGSMAGLTALVVARNEVAGYDVRKLGLAGQAHTPLRIYCSTETHSWIAKTANLLGLGERAVRWVPVDAEFKIDLAALASAIREDRAAGYRPMCVVGNAGTVNTGAVDDLAAMAAISRDEGVWFHVDGAFGAWARIAPGVRNVVAGMEEADSVSFDLHKWMYLPFEIACVLVRDSNAHLRTFAQSASYLAETRRGVIAGGLPFADRGVELTRGFKALKAWMSLKSHGVDAYAALIDQNVAQARLLADLVRASASLELLAPVQLNVVCFRYVAPGVSGTRLDRINEEIVLRIQERGVAVPSSTVLGGKFAIRAAFVNHRTQTQDVEALADAVVSVGNEIV